MSMQAFDDLLNDSLAPFITLGEQIGGLVKQQVDLVKQAFDVQRGFIDFASKAEKPSSDQELLKLLKPTSDLIIKIQDIREKNRKHDSFNHLSAVSEGISALSWVTIAKTPAPFVKEMADSAQFYTNKVLVTYKDKPDQAHHIEWAKAWVTFLTELQQFIRKHHTTGLVWAKVASANPALGPPPPPPPSSLFGAVASAAVDGLQDARAALFASINQGADIAKGLRKVTSDQMTHKNPNLRTSSVVPATGKASPAGTTAWNACVAKGAPKFALDGKKWQVENLDGQKELVISDTQLSQSVHVYRCDNCILFVKGKINSIIVDSCKKFSIVFDSLVSVAELIHCENVQVQVMETAPIITMDCVDNIEIFLSPKSLGVELLSSKSSSINVSVANNDGGDYIEHAIPEQLRSFWTGRSFKTEAVAKN